MNSKLKALTLSAAFTAFSFLSFALVEWRGLKAQGQLSDVGILAHVWNIIFGWPLLTEWLTYEFAFFLLVLAIVLRRRK